MKNPKLSRAGRKGRKASPWNSRPMVSSPENRARMESWKATAMIEAAKFGAES